MSAILRIVLDVNIWVSNLIATERGRQGTSIHKIVSAVAGGRWGHEGRPAQLVVSHEMLDTLATVLFRRGARTASVEAYADMIRSVMIFGPDQLDPYLPLGGREQFAMHDREDAGVLALAFASRADLIVTDNMKDFETSDAERVDTRLIQAPSGSRQLYALRHRQARADVVVAHPFDVAEWLDRDVDFAPDALWSRLTNAVR